MKVLTLLRVPRQEVKNVLHLVGTYPLGEWKEILTPQGGKTEWTTNHRHQGPPEGELGEAHHHRHHQHHDLLLAITLVPILVPVRAALPDTMVAEVTILEEVKIDTTVRHTGAEMTTDHLVGGGLVVLRGDLEDHIPLLHFERGIEGRGHCLLVIECVREKTRVLSDGLRIGIVTVPTIRGAALLAGTWSK